MDSEMLSEFDGRLTTQELDDLYEVPIEIDPIEIDDPWADCPNPNHEDHQASTAGNSSTISAPIVSFGTNLFRGVHNTLFGRGARPTSPQSYPMTTFSHRQVSAPPAGPQSESNLKRSEPTDSRTNEDNKVRVKIFILESHLRNSP